MKNPALGPRTTRRLAVAARAAAGRAYAPYSGFAVGAAVLASSGKIYTGCNVENAAFGLGTCAERNAVAAAIGAGERRLKAVAVYTPTDKPTAPCGGCRQFIREFGPRTAVLCLCDSAETIEGSAASLLPGAFTPGDLLRGSRG
jgi:cytidine deaminase